MKKVHVRLAALAACGVSTVALAGLAQAQPTAPQQARATTIRVTATDFRFALSARAARKGTVVFVVKNAGKLPHDFRITGKRTPRLAAGATARLTVRFAKAGKFPYICTVPGHAASGMKGVFTVR